MGISDAAPGYNLSPLIKPPIEQEQLQRYATASGDYNPIHLDPAAARRVGLDGVIAHGMLSMAFLGQFVNQQLGDEPRARVGQLKVRYIGMVHLGDTLTCLGTVAARTHSEQETTITLACRVQNQRGEQVTVGEAIVYIQRP